MRKHRDTSVLGAASLGFILLAAGAANASSVSIGFDVLPDGTAFPAQTTFAATAGPLRDQFQADGVHFNGGGGVLTGNFGVAGFNSANFLAFNVRPAAAYANGTGPVPLPPEQITTDRPADLVKVLVGSPEPVPGTATLTAYDSTGAVVATSQLALSASAAPLQVQSTTYNIASVQLALTGSRSMAASNLVLMVQDQVNVPPVTQCSLAGPLGGGGWYTGDVQATLTATDVDDTVVSTQFSLDGGNWQPYSAQVLVTGDGTHTLEFKSLDSGGLWEDAQSVTFKIDSTKPTVTLTLSRHILWPPHGQMVPVVVNGSASDPSPGSGLAGVTFQVQDEYGVCQPTLTQFGQTILLQSSRRGRDWRGRWYKVTATATDVAGLQTSVSQWVLVPHDCRHHMEEPVLPVPPVPPVPPAPPVRRWQSRHLHH